MKFSHCEEERDDRHLDILIDEENGLRIIVSRLGAELISLARVNEVGAWIGFLRSKTWHFVGSTIEGSGATLKYRITPQDFSPTEYPLKVSVDLTYTIDLNKVSVLFEFWNDEPELPAHIAFGLHPGFAATSFETFRLQMPPGCYRRHFSPGDYLSGETRDFDFPGGEMPFPKSELPGSCILEFVDAPLREFCYVDPPSGRWVSVDLTGVPYLTLWSDGGPFLCIEPCWGLTDHHEQRAFEDKEGIHTISPGGELRTSFGMTPQLASCD